MKSLHKLHQIVLVNLGQICSIGIARDQKTVTSRCEDEGDSFLTITLPKFSKSLEKGLDEGIWPKRDMSPSWKHIRGLPVFLRGFLLRIFDESGSILDEPDPDCIWAIRQFCLLSQKIERECSEDRIFKAFDGFIKTDKSLVDLKDRIDPERMTRFLRVSHELFGEVFQHCDRVIAEFGLIPRHGPGSVAERLTQKEKRRYDYWTDRLESVFPYWRYTVNSGYAVPRVVDPSSEIPVRVITVPKTQSTPRIIAIEPSSVQYAQQGLKREMYEMIGRGPLRKILGFQDQTRNQKLAKYASSSQRFATLDLSEASDRVPWFLVASMLERYPHLADFVSATRSYRADVKHFGVIDLNKFASMGSALTFPIEAMIFTILAACGMQEQKRRYRISRGPNNLAKRLRGNLSVYGDDIIVPTDTVGSVIDWLEHFGAKVNQHKSFWTGKFRESCGAEYYDGHDVTVVRIRSEVPTSRNDAANIAAYIDFRNRMFLSGLWSVVKVIDEELDSLIDSPYVYVTQNAFSGFLSRATFNRPLPTGERFNPHLQRYEVRVPVLIPLGRSYRIDGEAGLLEWFHSSLTKGDLLDRYDSQERPTSFSIKRRWLPSYTLGGGPD